MSALIEDERSRTPAKATPQTSMAGLDNAIRNGYYYQARNLIDTGRLEGRLRDVQGRTPLLRVVDVSDENVAMMLARRLIRQGADINAIDHKGRNVLMYSVTRKHEQLLPKLLDNMHIIVSKSSLLAPQILEGGYEFKKYIKHSTNKFAKQRGV